MRAGPGIIRQIRTVQAPCSVIILALPVTDVAAVRMPAISIHSETVYPCPALKNSGLEGDGKMSSNEVIEQKKAYLRSYRNAVRQEKILSDEILRLHMDLTLLDFTEADNLPACTAKIKDMIGHLQRLRLEKILQYSDISKYIEQVPDDTERDLLTLKYLQGKTWEQVAESLGYSWQWVHRLHNRALLHFNMETDDGKR